MKQKKAKQQCYYVSFSNPDLPLPLTCLYADLCVCVCVFCRYRTVTISPATNIYVLTQFRATLSILLHTCMVLCFAIVSAAYNKCESEHERKKSMYLPAHFLLLLVLWLSVYVCVCVYSFYVR